MNIANPTDLSTSQLTEEQEIYKENIIDHYKHPRNKKKLENATHKENGINPMCGDHITIYLIIKDNKIEEITFTGDGCAISQASVSLLTDELLGKDLDFAKKITDQNVYDLLGIPISHTRTKCALLSIKTVQKAINLNQ
ncbi:SUF system NifU family Fe-S cluster assembly protein [archaeon]|mgnify:FL=1|nr:SUF system NifU family Fe-S cluster assembly protein [archaeon]MBT6761986.1 SUF system NifU family Fe-S cluster assembly protein [archaeon]